MRDALRHRLQSALLEREHDEIAGREAVVPLRIVVGVGDHLSIEAPVFLTALGHRFDLTPAKH